MLSQRWLTSLLSTVGICLVVPLSSLRADMLFLPSTGTDANGNVLLGGSADPHYTVIGPGIPGGGPAVVYSSGNVFGGWVANDLHSAWIGWQDSFSSSPHGTYTYELHFDLTGYDPASATLSGFWAADQFGSINLNGSSTGISVPDGNWNASGFPNLNPFTISSGFQAGVNTLDFIVSEPDDGDGLRVRSLAVSASAVPEPSSGLLTLMVGIVLFAVRFRRRRWVLT